MTTSVDVADKYLKAKKLPHMWCAGCGNGIVLGALLRAIENVGYEQQDVVLVSGIGCSSRAPGYVNLCGLHTVHGRALAFATGIKFSNPNLKVIALMGDGDCSSIGGNHLIHAARRNIDLTAIVFNNSNYGMTGGQYSPTTPLGSMTKTSPYGHMEPHFDLCDLAAGAGASYVARSTTYHVTTLVKYMENALVHRGFSLVDAICDCPTLFGRGNKLGNAGKMLLLQKEQAVMLNQAKKMTPEELENRIVIGEFVNVERPEYTAQYANLIEKAQMEAR
jgi:2-oxoglutarate ferredoxin oxidoreductase subunit beta